MAKVSRFATTRMSASLNADYRSDENVKDSFYLDGRVARKREEDGADITSSSEDRGFFYAVFATNDLNFNTQDSDCVPALHEMTEAIKQSNDKIDNEINDLADCAVEVGGRATIAREGVRQSYFSGVIVKEAEIAAVTTGGGCAFLYRNNALYPLTTCDYDLVNADYHGNTVERMMDFSAGVAGTIRYSNIAQVQANDAIILCNKEVLHTIGQREMINILYNYDNSGDAAAEIIDLARTKNEDDSLQILIAFVEEVIPADRTSKINLGLFQNQNDLASQETTRYDPSYTSEKQADLENDSKVSEDEVPFTPKYTFDNDTAKSEDEDGVGAETLKEDDPFKPSYPEEDTLPITPTPDLSTLEEQEISPVDETEIDHDDVPVFEPIVTGSYSQDSDAFAAGRQYVDEDYEALDQDTYSDEAWEDDRSELDSNRNRAYADDYYEDDYEDEYKEDYEDDYDVYADKPSNAKRNILYIVLILICLACAYALVRMIFFKDDKASETKEIDSTISEPAIIETTLESDVKTPIQTGDISDDQTTDDVNDADNVETGDLSGTAYVNVETLNLRAGPSTETDIVAQLGMNEIVEIVEYAGDGWYQVTTTEGYNGYILGDYLTD